MKLSKLLEAKELVFTHRDAEVLWKNINEASFDGAMDFKKTEIMLLDQDAMNTHISDADRQKFSMPKDGDVMGFVKYREVSEKALILLSTNVKSEKEFEQVLAHEMVHQYLITTEKHYGHGPKFNAFKDKIAQYRGMKLLGAEY
jgi:hypothetical protein